MALKEAESSEPRLRVNQTSLEAVEVGEAKKGLWGDDWRRRMWRGEQGKASQWWKLAVTRLAHLYQLENMFGDSGPAGGTTMRIPNPAAGRMAEEGVWAGAINRHCELVAGACYNYDHCRQETMSDHPKVVSEPVVHASSGSLLQSQGNDTSEEGSGSGC
jgi:hypothetical protein